MGTSGFSAGVGRDENEVVYCAGFLESGQSAVNGPIEQPASRGKQGDRQAQRSD